MLKRETNEKSWKVLEGKHNDGQHKCTFHRPMENPFSIKMMGILEENCRCYGFTGNLMADEVNKG